MSHQHKDKCCNLDKNQKSSDVKTVPVRNSAQVAGMINEGNPNTEPILPVTVAHDQQEAQVVKQAIKDDQGLAPVSKDIEVTVKDGQIILEGEVCTKQQMNLVTNTAKAVGVNDKVHNQLEVTPKKEGCHEHKSK